LYIKSKTARSIPTVILFALNALGYIPIIGYPIFTYLSVFPVLIVNIFFLGLFLGINRIIPFTPLILMLDCYCFDDLCSTTAFLRAGPVFPL
jgi:hypothetical protein